MLLLTPYRCACAARVAVVCLSVCYFGIIIMSVTNGLRAKIKRYGEKSKWLLSTLAQSANSEDEEQSNTTDAARETGSKLLCACVIIIMHILNTCTCFFGGEGFAPIIAM